MFIEKFQTDRENSEGSGMLTGARHYEFSKPLLALSHVTVNAV